MDKSYFLVFWDSTELFSECNPKKKKKKKKKNFYKKIFSLKMDSLT